MPSASWLPAPPADMAKLVITPPLSLKLPVYLKAFDELIGLMVIVVIVGFVVFRFAPE